MEHFLILRTPWALLQIAGPLGICLCPSYSTAPAYPGLSRMVGLFESQISGEREESDQWGGVIFSLFHYVERVIQSDQLD